ncbi:MAG: hypothetical protein WB802_05440 [Candidatus Dormiibacterota bacterium]|jgi:hypothetical protein
MGIDHGPGAAGDEPARAGDQPAKAADEPSSALVALAGEGTVTLGVGEIRALATELATQLFERWELAVHEQFQAELSIRLEAELEHREHEARQLREEVQERRQRIDNPWPTRHGAWGHGTWEMENTVRRQAAQLAQTEREMRMLRERLRELGHPADDPVLTVDVEQEEPAPAEADEEAL